jgi:hypothetical protein
VPDSPADHSSALGDPHLGHVGQIERAHELFCVVCGCQWEREGGLLIIDHLEAVEARQAPQPAPGKDMVVRVADAPAESKLQRQVQDDITPWQRTPGG